MRCDVNVSLHRKGEPFGTRTELKNLNSLSNMARAIKKEAERQERLLESGEGVRQATLRYDAAADEVGIMRIKENSDDYRYFPEPDILPFIIPAEMIEEERRKLPELPQERYRRYTGELGLSAESAGQIYKYKRAGDFLDEVIGLGGSPKNTSSLIIRGIYPGMPLEEDKEAFETKADAAETAELVKLADEKKISFNRAVELLGEMLASGRPVSELLTAADTAGVSDDEMKKLCEEAAAENPKAFSDMQNGKEKAINVLLGYIMKKTRGKADSRVASEILLGMVNVSKK